MTFKAMQSWPKIVVLKIDLAGVPCRLRWSLEVKQRLFCFVLNLGFDA